MGNTCILILNQRNPRLDKRLISVFNKNTPDFSKGVIKIHQII